MANLSQQRRERMLDFLEKIKSKNKDDDDALLSIGEIENELTEKKYGLVWEVHSEDVEDRMVDDIPIFTEDKSREIECNDTRYNFIIEGDNLHSLHLLEKTHKEKIDVIYIDPPYNTGAKNWKYNNDYVDGNDTFRHSKWISFMERRLRIAWNLLRDTGVLILTIDDYEVENITLLMNELFGEEHYLGTVVIKNNPQGRSSVNGFQISHEYALFYGKDNSRINTLPRNDEQIARYGEVDELGAFEWRNFRAQYSTESPTMVYPIYIKKDCSDFRIPNMQWDAENKTYNVLEQPSDDEIVSLPKAEDGRMRTWKWGIETVLREKDKQMGVRKDRSGNPAVYYKGRMKSDGMQPYTFWDNPDYSASTFGANILAEIVGKKQFDYPKSIYAVRDCIRVATDKPDAIVLDFFAGSGTTGEAVLELNRDDGGHRTFILCTNNENGICENVTYPRVKSVITGKKPNGDDLIIPAKKEDLIYEKKMSLSILKDSSSTLAEMEKISNNLAGSYKRIKTVFEDGFVRLYGVKDAKTQPIPAALKYYNTDYISKSDPNLTDLLIDKSDELIQLEFGIKVDREKYISIFTDEEADELEQKWDSYSDINAIYISRRVLLTGKQSELFYTKDVYVVPDYYFREELREAGEA